MVPMFTKENRMLQLEWTQARRCSISSWKTKNATSVVCYAQSLVCGEI